MTLPHDATFVLICLQGLVVFGLLMCGLARLYPARRPVTVDRGLAVSKQRQTPPTTSVALPPRLTSAAELGRLAAVIETAKNRVETITTCQRSASRHLDSAETALNALLAEIVAVMPPTITPSVQPRRTMAIAA